MASGNRTTTFDTNEVIFNAPVTLTGAVTAPTLPTLTGAETLQNKSIIFINNRSSNAFPSTIVSTFIQQTDSVSWVGAIISPPRALSITKVNNLITLRFESFSGLNVVNSTIIGGAYALPLIFRPLQNTLTPVFVFNNNSIQADMGRLEVTTLGVLTLSKDAVGGVFTNSGNLCGAASAFSVSYQAAN